MSEVDLQKNQYLLHLNSFLPQWEGDREGSKALFILKISLDFVNFKAKLLLNNFA